MIKNIIFDLGGVIITLDHQYAVKCFERLGLPDAALQLDPYTQGGMFGDLEEGKITAEEFIARIKEFEKNPRPRFNAYSRQMFLEKYSEESVVKKFREVLFD